MQSLLKRLADFKSRLCDPAQKSLVVSYGELAAAALWKLEEATY
uniref:Uncharacterized protein n=1 Tax=Anguilla anguilla TaxID=7936 RepID=A0A0E9PVG8_ANGAN